MKLFKRSSRGLYALPEKKQKELLLKAAKSANKKQQALEARYNKLQTQK